MPAWSMTSNYGGVFRSDDAGAHWQQLGSGLDGRDVFCARRKPKMAPS